MTADEMVKLFRELGFPAAVAIFVLWRVEARLVEIKDALIDLRIAFALKSKREE